MYKYILLLSLLYLSCSKSNGNKITYQYKSVLNIVPKDVNHKNIKLNKKTYSRILDSSNVEYIPLETNEESLIGKIDKIIQIENNFYILDKKNSKGVFVFNNKGDFLYKIQRLGKGPGEYRGIKDFNFNKYTKQLEIFDLSKNKILIYSLKGEYIKEEKAINSHKFIPVNENRRYFYSKFLPNKDMLKLDGNFRLLCVDNIGLIKNHYLGFKNETLFKSNIINPYNNFYANDAGDILLIESYNNNIYEINKGEINAKYKLNFNNYGIRDDFLESNINDKHRFIKENKLAYISNVLYENSNELVFWYSKKFRREVRYSLKDDSYTECIYYYVEGDNIFISPSIFFNKQLSISIIEPYTLNNQNNENITLSKRINKIKKEMKDLSNPIIVKIKR